MLIEIIWYESRLFSSWLLFLDELSKSFGFFLISVFYGILIAIFFGVLPIYIKGIYSLLLLLALFVVENEADFIIFYSSFL